MGGLIALCLFAAGCHRLASGIAGSGHASAEERAIGGFRSVELHGALQAEIHVGPAVRLTVSGDDNLLPHLRTRLVGDALVADTDADVAPRLPLKVTLDIPALRSLSLSGACGATVAGLQGGRLSLVASGASAIAAKGTADELTVNAHGASRVDARELRVPSVVVRLSGASHADLCAGSALDLQASGASSVDSYCHPGQLKQDITGASSFHTH
jgi:hypothetical protein